MTILFFSILSACAAMDGFINLMLTGKLFPSSAEKAAAIDALYND